MAETRLNAIYAPVMYIVETLCVLVVFGVGAWEVSGGRVNIGYAARGATDAQIHAAAGVAGAHDVITSLPDGYRTQVGERGRLLSGGQRQRIALARAVLRDAPVLILDEPTAGLDPASAGALMPLLRSAMAGRTIIVITHDRALAAAADDILHIPGPVAPADPPGRAGGAAIRR